MKDDIALLRAVASVFLRRLLTKVLIISIGSITVICLVISWLALEVHATWWLALGLIVPSLSILTLIGLLGGVVIRGISPRMLSKTEVNSIRTYTDTLLATVESLRMPAPVFGFLVIKDYIIHHDLRRLERLIHDSGALASGYAKLKRIVSGDT